MLGQVAPRRRSTVIAELFGLRLRGLPACLVAWTYHRYSCRPSR
jgi:hypothetical protein